MVDSTPTSVWYGVDDVLVSRAHAEHLLAAIPHAERRELSGGHVLDDRDLSAVYEWLASASR
jgi:predicted esterase